MRLEGGNENVHPHDALPAAMPLAPVPALKPVEIDRPMAPVIPLRPGIETRPIAIVDDHAFVGRLSAAVSAYRQRRAIIKQPQRHNGDSRGKRL